MSLLSGLGIVLSLVFGCLLLVLVAELYYLLWWKKQTITSSNCNRVKEDYSNHTKEMFYLFCWDKPTTIINNHSTSNTLTANPSVNHNDPDLEMGLGSRKDLLLKALGEEGVESELMRLHNLAGPPRFLFTIKEETKEDLESDDGKSKGGDRSLGDLIVALESQTPFLSPMSSAPFKGSPKILGHKSHNNCNYNNPLFESSVEAELFRLKSSPPPKFKFLRDAEEKLYRRLIEKAQKSGVLQEVILDNSQSYLTSMEEEKGSSLKKSNDIDNGGKIKEGSLMKCNDIHCPSQVLPLVSSPTDEKNSSLH